MSASPASRTAERGSAMSLAIVITLLASIAVVAINETLDWSGDRARSRTDRSRNVAIIDRALTAYEFALESNLATGAAGYKLDKTALDRLALEEPGASVVDNDTFGPSFQEHGLHKTWMPQGYDFSMRVPQDTQTVAWWQLIAVVPPSGSNGNLAAYVRTWISSSDNSLVSTEPRIARVEMRPGRFTDFQMIVDGPLVIGAGTIIRGKIHTNGYEDSYLADQFTQSSHPLKLNSGGAPTCYKGSAFSTGQGQIEGTCTSADGSTIPMDANNGRLIDLHRGVTHLEMLEGMCGTSVTCPSGGSPWQITLAGNGATVRSASGSTTNVTAGTGNVIYVEGDVTLTGTLTSGALTIGVANAPGTFSTYGAASVSLLGDGLIGAVNPGTLGLIVEGDVMPRIDQGHCPSGLTAALVSTSGSLTFPAQYRVPSMSGTVPLCDKTFKFLGSLGTHYMPMLSMSWTTGQHVGYTERDYEYDTRLRSNPPPLFLTTGPWQVTSWKDANADCLPQAQLVNSDCG